MKINIIKNIICKIIIKKNKHGNYDIKNVNSYFTIGFSFINDFSK
jgi:hypothetical protein